MKNNISKLSIFSAILASLLLCACAYEPPSAIADSEMSEGRTDATLPACDDLGKEYIDSFIFIGESTTYHLKSRGVLSDGTDTKQVWAPKSGTVNLDTTISSLKIVYPETGELLSVGEAAKLKKPKRIILTFGLNGAITKVRMGEEYFKSCYLTLINAIREASPETEIFIQSCFPVARNMDMKAYGIEVKALNAHINTINGWAHSLACEQGLSYLNTREALCDSEGYLKDAYQAGDGYHLTADAYNEVIKYIRTHGNKK
jgi:hypothetical protein